MDSFLCPPPAGAAADEVKVSDSAAFDICKQVINTLASRMNGKATEQHYSRSKQWGYVLRAKIMFERKSVPGTALATCWTNPGPDVKIAVRMDCC